MIANVAVIDRRAMGLLAVFTAYFSISLFKWFIFEPSSSELFWIVDVLSHVILPLLFIWILEKAFSVSPRLYGLGKLQNDGRRLNPWLASFIYTILLGAAHFIGYISGLVAQTLAGEVVAPVIDYHLMIPSSGAARILALFYFALSASVFEEIFFRGIFQLLFDIFFPNVQRGAVVIFSSVLFALTHWASGLVAISASLLFGLVAALLFSFQRDLRPLIFSHFLLDTFVALN